MGYGKRSAEADPLVYHPNGAVTPFDPANAAATAAHLATKGYPYYAGYPYAVYGKRSAEADPLVYHANGAITPFDPANAAATAAHLATKGYTYYAGYPYAVYGKRSADADAQLITYANGAVVPADYNNLAATSAHLASKGYLHYAGYPYVYGKRSAEAEADPQFLYAALPYAYVVPALVAHPNGAVVPVEPADVVKARAEHLAAVAAES